MDTNFSCFVDKNGHSFSATDIDNAMKDQFFEFEFDLELRRFRLIYLPKLSIIKSIHWEAAQSFFGRRVGTPEHLMKFVKTVHFSKAGLAKLLTTERRQEFLAACTLIEKESTDKCGANDPCLESGCAFEGTDDVCLNAVLLSEGRCLRACTDIWLSKFEGSENRIDVWKN